MEEDKNIKPLIPQIAEIGKELFSDFLSDSTRQRQLYILLSSVVAILLAFPYIKNVQGELAGIKFSFVDLVVARHIAGWICLYFLLVYISSVIQDVQYHRYKTILAQYQLDLMLRVQDLNSQVEEIERLKEALGQEGRASEIFQNLLNPEPTLKKRLKARLQNTGTVVRNIFYAVLELLISPRQMFDEELSRDIEKMVREDVFLKNTGVPAVENQLEAEKKRLRDKLIKATREREYTSLREIRNRYDIFNRTRLLLEVFFPMGISSFAIWASLVR